MLLPTPPDNKEKLLYLTQNKYFYYVPAVVSSLLLLTGFVLFTLQHYSLLFFLPLILVLFLYLFVSYFIGLSPSSFSYPAHLELTKYENLHRVSVDIYLPSCGEEIAILRNTYGYVWQLLRANEDLFNIKVWVLDDSKRLQVKGLSEEFDFFYVTRPDNHMKKAGNLRNAFPLTSGEFIVIFDADFVPREDFLQETLPYFTDGKVAIVQTPQFFNVSKHQTPIEQGAGYIQEYFYRNVQVNRSFFSAPICVGTCAVYRRSALEPFGGTAPIGYSEDLHTGWNVTKAGYIVKYLPINLSKGICPSDLKTFFYQQYRWALGSTTLCMNPEFWKSNLTLMQKVCYSSGFGYYIATSLGLILTPVPAMIMLTFWPEKIFWYNYVFSIPSFFMTTVIFVAWSKTNFTPYFVVARFAQYWAHAFALFDKMRGDLVPWVTKNQKQDARFPLFKKLNVIWILSLLTVVSIGLIKNVSGDNWFQFIPLIFLTLYNVTIALVLIRQY